jgi:hypothetical protein
MSFTSVDIGFSEKRYSFEGPDFGTDFEQMLDRDDTMGGPDGDGPDSIGGEDGDIPDSIGFNRRRRRRHSRLNRR